VKSASKSWILVLLATGALALGVFWWLRGGREQLLLTLQPKFQVTGIDATTATMTLRRMNQTYVVDCAKTCADFTTGNSYPMLDRGGIIEFRKSGNTRRMRVLQVHIDFDTVTGGRG
jgi:hypothetical protein